VTGSRSPNMETRPPRRAGAIQLPWSGSEYFVLDPAVIQRSVSAGTAQADVGGQILDVSVHRCLPTFTDAACVHVRDGGRAAIQVHPADAPSLGEPIAQAVKLIRQFVPQIGQLGGDSRWFIRVIFQADATETMPQRPPRHVPRVCAG
ncbi:MAG: hypothetical protein KDB26_14745, partial [Microthrixaceae bacterium]|nr:hypothetical protein [Microthrixaceae bacterium]